MDLCAQFIYAITVQGIDGILSFHTDSGSQARILSRAAHQPIKILFIVAELFGLYCA
ncbi:hypothetical protein AXX16_0973 [Serratia rubidaea]|nr:hypothetical protein AXX16_0973 [Serratia rubidaea]